MRTRLDVGRLAGMAIVTFSVEAGLMSVQIDDDGYVLDTDDLARAVRLTLTAPEVVPITDRQYRQAVELLATMIVDWVQRSEPHSTSDNHTGSEQPTADPPGGGTTAEQPSPT
jgi:hypothetical protein